MQQKKDAKLIGHIRNERRIVPIFDMTESSNINSEHLKPFFYGLTEIYKEIQEIQLNTALKKTKEVHIKLDALLKKYGETLPINYYFFLLRMKKALNKLLIFSTLQDERFKETRNRLIQDISLNLIKILQPYFQP